MIENIDVLATFMQTQLSYMVVWMNIVSTSYLVYIRVIEFDNMSILAEIDLAACQILLFSCILFT